MPTLQSLQSAMLPGNHFSLSQFPDDIPVPLILHHLQVLPATLAPVGLHLPVAPSLAMPASLHHFTLPLSETLTT